MDNSTGKVYNLAINMFYFIDKILLLIQDKIQIKLEKSELHEREIFNVFIHVKGSII